MADPATTWAVLGVLALAWAAVLLPPAWRARRFWRGAGPWPRPEPAAVPPPRSHVQRVEAALVDWEALGWAP